MATTQHMLTTFAIANVTNYLEFCSTSNLALTTNNIQSYIRSRDFDKKVKNTSKKFNSLKLKIKPNDYVIFTQQCRSIELEVINFNNKPSVVINYLDYPKESEVIAVLTVEYIIKSYDKFSIISPKKNCLRSCIAYDVDPAIKELLYNKTLTTC